LSLQRKLRGFFKKQLLTKKNEILRDIKSFGRTRDFLWRSFFIIADEAISEGYDITSELLDLAAASLMLYKKREKIYALRELAYRLVKLQQFSNALSLFKIALRESNKIPNTYKRLLNKAMILNYIFSSGFDELGEMVLERAIRDAFYLPPTKAARVLVFLGKALAKCDVGRADSIILSGMDFINKCKSSLCKVKILASIAMGYINISRDPENVRMAKKWLKEAFEIIDEMPPRDSLNALASILGEIYEVDFQKAKQIMDFILSNVDLNEEGLNIVFKAVKSLILAGDSDISYIALSWLEDKIMRTKMKGIIRMFYLSKTVKYFGIIDGYRAQFIGKMLAGSIKRVLENRNNIVYIPRELVLSIVNLSAADVSLAFDLYKSMLDRIRENHKETLSFLMAYSKPLFEAFPKPYIRMVRKGVRSILDMSDEKVIETLPTILNAIPSSSLSILDKLINKALRSIERLENKDSIIVLAEIAAAISYKTPWWSQELLDYALENLEKLPLNERPYVLIEASKRVYPYSPKIARELLRLVVQIVQESNLKDAEKVLLEISRQTRILFKDQAWARQIEVLAKEIRRSSERKKKL